MSKLKNNQNPLILMNKEIFPLNKAKMTKNNRRCKKNKDKMNKIMNKIIA